MSSLLLVRFLFYILVNEMLFHNCYLVVEFTSLMVKARNCMNHQLAFCKYFSLIHIRSLLMTIKKSAQALKTTQNTITVLLKTQERKETIKKRLLNNTIAVLLS